MLELLERDTESPPPWHKTYSKTCGGWEPARTVDIGSRQELYMDPVYGVTASKSSRARAA